MRKMKEQTVSNTTPRAVVYACADLGIDTTRLFSKINLSESYIMQPDGRTSFKDVVRLWQESYKQTRERMIGVKAASQLPFGAFKVIDYMMATSQTPRDGLSKALKYYPLINEGFDLEIKLKGKFGFVELKNPADPKMLPFHYVDFVFACVLSRIRFCATLDWVPLEIQLTVREPKDPSEYFQAFGAPIKFNHDINRIVFERDSLEIQQPNADPYLCEMLDIHAKHLIQRLPPEKDVLYELGRILREKLPHGEIDLNSMAKEMSMSRRSLQRRLKNQGVSYRKVLNQTRFEIARELLNQKDVSAEEIAGMVGYSEKSSFYRAFKQWTSKTPRDF